MHCGATVPPAATTTFRRCRSTPRSLADVAGRIGVVVDALGPFLRRPTDLSDLVELLRPRVRDLKNLRNGRRRRPLLVHVRSEYCTAPGRRTFRQLDLLLELDARTRSAKGDPCPWS